MLRNKLSKLIVSIMAAVMITGAGFGGQVVKATTTEVKVESQAQNQQAQTKTVFNITATTTQPEIENAIKDTNTTTIKVGTNVTFSASVIRELNARTTPLTIEVETGGSIILPTLTNLDGKGNLIISRGTGVTGSLIIAEGDVSISGVKFNNGQGVIIEGSKTTPVTNLNLTNNVVDKGQFIATDLFNKTTDKTFVGSNTTNGANQIINGSLAGNAAVLDKVTVNSLLEVQIEGRVSGVAGNTVSIEIQDLTTGGTTSYSEPVQVDPNNGKISHTFKSAVLKPGTSYLVEVQDAINPLAKMEISTNKLSVTNITTTSANINIPVGIVPTTGTTKIYVKDSKGNNLVGYPKDLNKGASIEVVTGLTPSTSYAYELVYESAAGQTGQIIKLSEGTFTTLNSSLVTGGGNNGSSTIVTPQITSNDISRSTIKDVTATLEVSNNTAYNSLRDAREITTNIKGVTAEFVNGKLELKGLVPEKEYSNLDITYINRDGRKGTIKVAKFTTKKSETKIRQFVTDVYRYALDRLADEEGFAYWVNGLEKKTITPDTLVKNLLNEKEFIEKHKTTEDKINGLYQVIVNRKSDSEGLKFWTSKYDGLIKTGYSDAMALRILVDQMVNEQEFKNRVKDLGL